MNNMSDKSRLLIITELFLPTKGGTAVWFDEVYRRIGGKEIHIVTADVPGAEEHDAKHTNSVHRVSLRRHWWLRPESLAMYAWFLFRCLGLVFQHRFDAVHAGRVLPEGLVGWVVSRLIRKPLVIYAHGEEITTWRQPGKFKAMCFVYRHADRIVANSDFTRNELLKIGVKPACIARISPGVDVERFRPRLACEDLREKLGLQDTQKLILSVGRLSRRKGFDQVIRGLPALCEQGFDVHYAIIGIGEDYDYLKELTRKHGVAERVHLLGHVSPEDLPRWYNACEVFAMPNREINGDTEGFGMVFLEASASGKPSLAGKAGGTGSAVIDGVTGFRLNGSDEHAVTEALRDILADSERSKEMGVAGRARAVAEYAWAQVAEKTRQLVRDVE